MHLEVSHYMNKGELSTWFTFIHSEKIIRPNSVYFLNKQLEDM